MKLATTFLALTLPLCSVAISQGSPDNPIAISIRAFVQDDSGSFVEATQAALGDLVEYRVTATNTDPTTLPAGSVSVFGPVPDSATYVVGSATENAEVVLDYSEDGATFTDVPPTPIRTLRWTLQEPLEPGQEIEVSYQVTINGGSAAPSTSGDFNCDDFSSQVAAQSFLESSPGDPYGLDSDNDGIACES